MTLAFLLFAFLCSNLIPTGKQMFGGPSFSTLNKIGIATALGGALLYSRTV